jgi:hypothetical protein
MSSVPAPTKPAAYSIHLTVKGPIQDSITLAELSKVIHQANELKTLAAEYGDVDGEVVIGKQKFKLEDGA